MTSRNALVRGGSRLAFDATSGLIDLVEKMHLTIQRAPGIVGAAPKGNTRGITGAVYGTIRGVTHALGRGVDAGLVPLAALLPESEPTAGREAFAGVLNGVYGDHLVRSDNPLAIAMNLRSAGRPVEAARMAQLDVTGKVLVLVHGLCMTDLQWTRNGHDHGAALARDGGYTALYLHYNSGLHVSTNGQAFADRLEDLVRRWPRRIEELVIVGHSMGGLLARSAYHYGRLAGHAWPGHLGKMVFLGTPHHGAPLERGGNWLDFMMALSPYSAPFTKLARMRSAGITDLRHGNLLDEDWSGQDRFALASDRRRPLPLPEGVACYAAAVTLGTRRGPISERLLGDGLVPLNSALGRHPRGERTLGIPASRQWIGHGIGHMDLLSDQTLYKQLSGWLIESGARRGARVG